MYRHKQSRHYLGQIPGCRARRHWRGHQGGHPTTVLLGRGWQYGDVQVRGTRRDADLEVEQTGRTAALQFQGGQGHLNDY